MRVAFADCMCFLPVSADYFQSLLSRILEFVSSFGVCFYLRACVCVCASALLRASVYAFPPCICVFRLTSLCLAFAHMPSCTIVRVCVCVELVLVSLLLPTVVI
eukprot:Opistho-2@26945